MIIKVKGKKFDEYDKRQATARQVRRHQDMLSGASRAKGPQRGDYEFCRKADQFLINMRRFKGEDVKKISKEYDQYQKEGRKYG